MDQNADQDGQTDGNAEISCNDAGGKAGQQENTGGFRTGSGPDLNGTFIVFLDVELLQLLFVFQSPNVAHKTDQNQSQNAHGGAADEAAPPGLPMAITCDGGKRDETGFSGNGENGEKKEDCCDNRKNFVFQFQFLTFPQCNHN